MKKPFHAAFLIALASAAYAQSPVYTGPAAVFSASPTIKVVGNLMPCADWDATGKLYLVSGAERRDMLPVKSGVVSPDREGNYTILVPSNRFPYGRYDLRYGNRQDFDKYYTRSIDIEGAVTTVAPIDGCAP